MLKVDKISAGYAKKQVLFDVSLEVNYGDVVLLTGGNGSGKSTLFKCIYNLVPLWGGEIQFQNKTTLGLKPAELIQKGIVYIPQKNFYFENLSVIENLHISGNILPQEILKDRILKALEQTGLYELRRRNPFNLSGGERKLLAFAMALIHKPKLLLFDEPYAGLDRKNSEIIKNLFENKIFTPEIGVIIIEHKSLALHQFTMKIELELGKNKI